MVVLQYLNLRGAHIMRTLLLSLLLVITHAVSAQSDTASSTVATKHFKKGSWELSFTGSITINNLEFKGTPLYPPELESYLTLSVAPAYYFFDGVSFEPEFLFLMGGDYSSNPRSLLILNL